MRSKNTPTNCSQRCCRGGFSLIELTVVVLIIGILAGVTVPRMMHLVADYQAESAAARVVADLRFARKLARARGKSETVTFDVAASRYSFSSIQDANSSSAVYSVDLTAYPYQGTIQLASFAGNSSVTFDGYGFPDVSGKVIVRSGDTQRTIKLVQSTGNVAIGAD